MAAADGWICCAYLNPNSGTHENDTAYPIAI